MKKILAIAFLSTAVIAVKAQDNPPADGPIVTHTLAQMMTLNATITPAWSVTLLSGSDSIKSVNGDRTNVYIHGTAEYYWDERFSTRADLYFLITKNSDPGGVKYNHGMQIGASCHLIKGSNIDPFIGFRAGLNVTQVLASTMTDGVDTALVAPPIHLDPTWAPVMGINFFGEHVFHFFIECAWMQGTYRPNVGPQMSLEEFRLSAGLGLNFSFYKPVDTVRQKI